MKMKDAANPKLSQSWWSKNKAKTLGVQLYQCIKDCKSKIAELDQK